MILKIIKERAKIACIKVANFPFIKTLEDFDFTFQPAVNKQEILDLATLRFIENNENILFVGTSGVGKTHLAPPLESTVPQIDILHILYLFKN